MKSIVSMTAAETFSVRRLSTSIVMRRNDFPSPFPSVSPLGCQHQQQQQVTEREWEQAHASERESG